MKLRLASLCTLLVGSVALAQTVVVPQIAITRVDNPNVTTYTFGAAQCNDTVTLQWVNTLTIALTSQCAQNPLKLWASPGDSCPTTPAATDTTFPDVPNLTLSSIRQGTFTVKISDLPAFKQSSFTDGGTALNCNSGKPFTQDHVICGSVDYAFFSGVGCSTPTSQTATPLLMVFDTQPPTPPTMNDPVPQDQGVRASFTVDSDTTVVIMEATEFVDDAGAGEYREIGETASTNSFVKGTGLKNNVPYLVRLRARDAAGNVSEPSAEQQVTPILTLGFWGVYKQAGGTEEGGCSVGSGLMPLLLAAFAFRRARKQVRRQP